MRNGIGSVPRFGLLGRTLTFALTLALVLTTTATVQAEFIRLSDGTILQGQVLNHDDNGLVVRRLDTGGEIKLRWGQLSGDDKLRLRKQFGLELPDVRGMVTVIGDRLELTDGGVLEGRIVEQDDTNYKVESMNDDEKLSTRLVLKSKVRDVFRQVPINALALKTRRELYDQVLAEHPPTNAAGHYLMAQYCKMLGVYDKGLEHCDKAVSADPKLEAKLAPLRELFTQMLAQAEIRRKIEDASKLIRKQQFGAAETALKEVLATQKLADALKRLAEERLAACAAAATDAIAKKWYALVDSLASKKVSESSCDLNTAKAYAAGQMNQDILDALSKQFEMDAARVQALFDARDRGKYRQIYVSFDMAALEGRMDLRTQGRALPQKQQQGQGQQGQGQQPANNPQAQMRELWRRIQANPEQAEALKKQLEELAKQFQGGVNRCIDPTDSQAAPHNAPHNMDADGVKSIEIPPMQDPVAQQGFGNSSGQPGRQWGQQGQGQGQQGQGQGRPGQQGNPNQQQEQISPDEMWRKSPTSMRKSYVIYLYCEKNQTFKREKEHESAGLVQLWYR